MATARCFYLKKTPGSMIHRGVDCLQAKNPLQISKASRHCCRQCWADKCVLLGTGMVEVWLQRLVDGMQGTVKNIIKRASRNVQEMRLEDFIFSHPAQIALLGIQFQWTADTQVWMHCHACTCLKGTKGPENFAVPWHELLMGILQAVRNLCRGCILRVCPHCCNPSCSLCIAVILQTPYAVLNPLIWKPS